MTKPTHPTKRQIIRLYTLATRAGLDTAGVHGEIFARYGIESSTELSREHYEAYCRDLIIRARAQRARAEHSKADDAAGYPRIHDKAGCERLLYQEWPNLVNGYPELAGPLVEVLDCERLFQRKTGLISPQVLRAEIQRWQKLPLGALNEAVKVWLERYSTKGARYFFAIALRIKREEVMKVMREDREAKKADQERERREAAAAAKERAVDARVEALLAGAGAVPVNVNGGCVCTRAEVYFKDEGGGGLRLIPCPWCESGIAKWRAAIAGNRSFGRLDWPAIREYVIEALERQGVS